MTRVFTEDEKAKIEEMALDNCHFDTIALALGMSRDTLKRHYAPFIKQKRAQGRAELAHVQRQVAVKDKDRTMLIWRGKQDLGQTDKQELTGKDGAPLLPLQIVVKPERADNGV